MAEEEFTKDYFKRRKGEIYNELKGYIAKIMPLLSGNTLKDADFLDEFVAAVNELIDIFERGFNNGYISEGGYTIILQSLKSMKENLISLKKNYNADEYINNRNKREVIKGFVNDSIKYYNRLSKYF